MYEKEHGQVHIFSDINSESSQIHQLAIMYHFEQTNDGIHPNALFQNLQKLFLCASDQHQ